MVSIASRDVSNWFEGIGAGKGVDFTYGKHKERANVIVLRSSRDVRPDFVAERDLLLFLGCVGKQVDEECCELIDPSEFNQLFPFLHDARYDSVAIITTKGLCSGL